MHLVHPQLRKIVRVVGQPSFVQSYERTSIYPKLTAFIEKWNVDIGDKVRKGDVLADLFVPELREHYGTTKATVQYRRDRVRLAQKQVDVAAADVKAAQARLEEARSILGKYEAEVERWDIQVKRLQREVDRTVVDPQILLESANQWKSNIAARDAAKAAIVRAAAELLADEAALAKAEVNVAVARSDLAVAQSEERRLEAWVGYLKLLAPYDGIIVARNANTWDFVLPTTGDPTAQMRAPDLSPGEKAAPIYVVERTDIVRVFVDVPERDANSIHVGNEARVKIWAYRDEWIRAAVTRLAWALNTRSRTMRVEIDLPNTGSQILPGMYAYGEVTVERPDVRALPKSALSHAGGKTFIWRYEDGHAGRTEVETGVEDGEWIEVTNRRVPTKGNEKDRWEPIDPSLQVLMGSKLFDPHRWRPRAAGRRAGAGRGRIGEEGAGPDRSRLDDPHESRTRIRWWEGAMTVRNQDRNSVAAGTTVIASSVVVDPDDVQIRDDDPESARPEDEQDEAQSRADDDAPPPDEDETEEGRHGVREEIGDVASEHPRVSWAAGILLVLLLVAALAGTGLTIWAFHEEGEARKAEQKAEQKAKKSRQTEEKYVSKFHEKEAEWKTALKELHEVQASEAAARRSEKETKAILDFMKRTLLSAGHPGDVSLADAFWAAGQGKDVTLHKAVDVAESKVNETFADRPTAEAAVREMLGLAYLSVGDPTRAVKQYERALRAARGHARVRAPRDGLLPQPARRRVPARRPRDRGRPPVRARPLFTRPRRRPGRPRIDAAAGEEIRRGRAETARVPEDPPEDPARRLDDRRDGVGPRRGALAAAEIRRGRAAVALGLRGDAPP